MKSYFMTLAAVLCCVMATTVFTACGNDDTENQIPSTPTVQAIQVVYEVKLVEDSQNYKSFTNYVNTTVEYLDENGQTKAETVSGISWSKTVTLKNFPARSSLKVQYAFNGNSPTEAAVHVGDARNVYYHVVMSDNGVTIKDLQDIFMGHSSSRLPHVISSGKNDNVIVFWCGHGHQNKLAWGSYEKVYSSQIRDILEQMKNEQRYRKILFAMDTCYSGSIGEACTGVPGVLFITAANAYETSKADMRDPEMRIWLSNGFTRAFQEAINETPDIPMRDLYYKLARQTVGSHATVYNVEHYGNMYFNTMKEFFK